MKSPQPDNSNSLVEQRIRYPNRWLLLLFSVLWLTDCGLTLWATNHGYIEVWNQWTMQVGHTWVFVLVKFLTLALVVGIVRWANTTFPYVAFVALVAFDVLIGTVTVANLVTIANS